MKYTIIQVKSYLRRVKILGRYKKKEFINIISKIEIDFIFLLSKCPETFSYTLSEAWIAGIPVVSGPFGALEERIKKCKGGWVLDKLDIKNILQFIEYIKSHPDEYSNIVSNIEAINIKSITQIKNEYLKIYNDTIQINNYNNNNNNKSISMDKKNNNKDDKTFNNFMFYSLLELRDYNTFKRLHKKACKVK